MDVLKLHGKLQLETEVLSYIVNIYSNDSAMDFQLSKHTSFVVNKGKPVKCFGTEMPDGSKLRSLVVENSNKYLSIFTRK